MIWWFVKTSTAGRPDFSLPDTLVDWSQVLSAILSILALYVALRARSNAKRDLAAERRTTFELEVLRDLGEMFPAVGRTAGGFARERTHERIHTPHPLP